MIAISLHYVWQESTSIYGDMLGAVSNQLSRLFKAAHSLQMVSLLLYW